MTTFIHSIARAVAKRAEYNRTVAALRNLPPDVAHDLDIYPIDAERIAHRAVYGA
jgi:uncharacterized protein YjiS (DUF1127 family)